MLYWLPTRARRGLFGLLSQHGKLSPQPTQASRRSTDTVTRRPNLQALRAAPSQAAPPRGPPPVDQLRRNMLPASVRETHLVRAAKMSRLALPTSVCLWNSRLNLLRHQSSTKQMKQQTRKITVCVLCGFSNKFGRRSLVTSVPVANNHVFMRLNVFTKGR